MITSAIKQIIESLINVLNYFESDWEPIVSRIIQTKHLARNETIIAKSVQTSHFQAINWYENIPRV